MENIIDLYNRGEYSTLLDHVRSDPTLMQTKFQSQSYNLKINLFQNAVIDGNTDVVNSLIDMDAKCLNITDEIHNFLKMEIQYFSWH